MEDSDESHPCEGDLAGVDEVVVLLVVGVESEHPEQEDVPGEHYHESEDIDVDVV